MAKKNFFEFYWSMNIQSINIQNRNNLNFKSTYPVVHWVAEANGSYAPVSNIHIVKKLQSKIVRMLNKPLFESKQPMKIIEQKLRAYIGWCDTDYRNVPKVRSFYNRLVSNPENYTPISYMISGKDVEFFDNVFAKNIGKAKSNSRVISGKIYSPQTVEAIDLYNKNGLNFVRDNAKQIKDSKGMIYMLHTKFEIVRNRAGKIKDYRFVDAKFLPAKGEKSPFNKIQQTLESTIDFKTTACIIIIYQAG